MRGLSENLQCKNPPFFINWLDPLDLSKRKKLSDLCYICPRGTREGMPLFFFEKSVFVKHTTANPPWFLFLWTLREFEKLNCALHSSHMKALSSLWVFWWLLRLPHWRKFEIANFTQESNFSMLRIFMFLQRCFVWIVHCTKCAALPISWMCVFVYCQSPFIWKIFGTQGTFENVWCHPNMGFLMKNKWLFWC